MVSKGILEGGIVSVDVKQSANDDEKEFVFNVIKKGKNSRSKAQSKIEIEKDEKISV